jgi:diguanylate cyclase (GGDEF)-like protein
MVSVIEGLYGLEPMQVYGFLLNRDVMESTVKLENQNHYQPSLISDDYVTDIDVFKITKSLSGMQDLYSDENFLQMMTAKVVSEMKTKDSFIVPVNYQGKYYIVQFEQVKDISGDPVGYIFIGGENWQLYDLAKSKELSFILTTVIYFILLLTIYYIKQRNDTISKLAMYDQLTGLYNRYVFFEFSKKVLEVSRRLQNPVCLAIMDIDYFKRVNDEFGHYTGDVVLKRIAQIVTQSSRRADILARFGGEELILLMADSGLLESREVAERIRHAIESYKFELAGKVTISIGLIEMKEDEFLDDAIIRADQALYEAKANGRNQTVTK